MELQLLSLCGTMLIFGIISSNAELIAYPHVGCFGGWRIRRYFNYEPRFRPGHDAVMECYFSVRREGFKIFALTKDSCLTGHDAEKHYTSFDKSNGCSGKGEGGRNAYDIYLVAGGGQSCDNLPDGEYQDTTFCNRFYTCTRGRATVQLCPEGLLFNPANRECRDTAPCPRGAPCMHAPDGEYIHPTSCRKYVVCHKNYAFEASCPAHLWFNTDTKECENPDKVNCRHDPCMDSPCLNEGHCRISHEEQRGYKCDCKVGYTGARCEKAEPKPCSAKPCKNGGTCKDLGGNRFECTCIPGFGGANCSEHSIFKASKILQGHPDYSKVLADYLHPVEIKGTDWKRCFRASENHFLSASFHAHCNHKGPTVTLVRVGVYVFGGYSNRDWISSTGYTHSIDAFLFSLRNHEYHHANHHDNHHDNHPFKALIYRHQNNGIYSNNGYGPTFGGGHDLYLANQCHVNTNSYTNLGHTYRPPFGYGYTSSQAKNIFAGSYNFKCDEYEVFYQA